MWPWIEIAARAVAAPDAKCLGGSGGSWTEKWQRSRPSSGSARRCGSRRCGAGPGCGALEGREPGCRAGPNSCVINPINSALECSLRPSDAFQQQVTPHCENVLRQENHPASRRPSFAGKTVALVEDDPRDHLRYGPILTPGIAGL